MEKCRVIVRGGGDIASGTVQKLYRSGFKVLILETEAPSSIRRNVSFSEAVYDGETIIEEIKCVLVNNYDEILTAWNNGYVPVAIDSKGELIKKIKPKVVIDGILAKRNLGTNRSMAPITIALGPGFQAGVDVDIVVETMRGHNLGRLIFAGNAQVNTGNPGTIGGYSRERVIYSQFKGEIKNLKEIGNIVRKDEAIAIINGNEIKTAIKGVLRGIIRDKTYVLKGLKIADIDPRLEEVDNCNTISDKARAIGGAVLEGILYFEAKQSLIE